MWITTGHENVPPMRTLVHVTVGDDNWTPSADDLVEIGEIFRNAVIGEDGTTIITRTGIELEASRKDGPDLCVVSVAKFVPQEENSEG